MPSPASSVLARASSTSGRLSEAAIERAIAALAICRNKMKNRGVTRARLIATEACRAAENGEDFRARVADELGLDLEVIDRETEATLAATGCTPLIDPQAEGVVLFDIGGGSSELVRLDRSHACRGGPPLPQIRGWISLPHGVVTLAERHGGHNVSREIYETMVAEVAALIAPFAREHGGDALARHSHARHLGHGDHHRRRASRSQALRPQPRRRLLDERAGDRRRGRAAAWP